MHQKCIESPSEYTVVSGMVTSYYLEEVMSLNPETVDG